MERETLIKQCRYYNGEEENPYGEGGDKAMFWFYERWWAEKMANGDTDVLSFYLSLYERVGLTDFEEDDGVPITLKAILFNRYEEWVGKYPGKLLVVDGDKLKFESNPRDFQAITEQIDSLLYGLF